MEYRPVTPTTLPPASIGLLTPDRNPLAPDPMAIATPDRNSLLPMECDEFFDAGSSFNSRSDGPHSCSTSDSSSAGSQDLCHGSNPHNQGVPKEPSTSEQGKPKNLPPLDVSQVPSSPLQLFSPSGGLVRLRIVSASRLHQSHFFQAMAPCAVVSVPGLKDRFVTKPALHGADTFPVWNSMATFRVLGEELKPLLVRRKSSLAEQHVGELKKSPASLGRWKSAGGSSGSKAGTPKHLEGLVSRPPSLWKAASGQLTPLLDNEPCVVVDIYSSPKLKKHLGRVVIPLKQALQNSSKPTFGTHDVLRKVFPGRIKKEGMLRVIVNVTPESSF